MTKRDSAKKSKVVLPELPSNPKPSFLTPSPLSWMDEFEAEAQCPVCDKKYKFLLRKPLDGAETFAYTPCVCGGSRLETGWVFGDYYWGFTITKPGIERITARYQ